MEKFLVYVWSVIFSIYLIPAGSVFTQVCQPKVCPPGFTLYEPSSKCYSLINTPMNKDGHIAQCSLLAVGAFIAAPLDAGEDLFIQRLITGQSSSERAKCQFLDTAGNKYDAYYLGAESFERKYCYGFEWILANGYRQRMDYKNFGANEPNCGYNREYCLSYFYSHWNDMQCESAYCSVCEFRLLKY